MRKSCCASNPSTPALPASSMPPPLAADPLPVPPPPEPHPNSPAAMHAAPPPVARRAAHCGRAASCAASQLARRHASGDAAHADYAHAAAIDPMSAPQGDAEGLAEGTLISHLLELRDRLLKAMLAVGICFIPCALYMNRLFTFVAEPLKKKLPGRCHADRDERGRAVHGPFQARNRARHRPGDAVRSVSGLGVRRPGPVSPRKEARRAAARLEHSAVLSGRGIRLLRRLSGHAQLLRLDHAERRADDDRHGQLPRFRDGPAARVRRGLRSARRHGVIGLDRVRENNHAQKEPRVGAPGDIHLRSLRHAARCSLAERHGGAHVLAVRDRDRDGGTAVEG